MEFDIGNIFYIVITLVAVIVGLLGRKKKPAGTGSGDGSGSAAPGFMENLEKVFNMGREDQFVVDLQDGEQDLESEVSEPAYEHAQDKPSLMEEYESLLKSKNQGISDGILSGMEIIDTEPLEIVDLEEDEGTDYYEVVEDFNAGTAVVYAAIINRLDY